MKLKRIVALLLAAVLLLSMAGCVETPGPTEPGTDPTDGPSGEKADYTITVQTAGGMAMEGLDIYIYADEALDDLEQFGKTDANGKATISLNRKDGYVAVLSGVPKGYALEESYELTGANTVITLTSSLVTDGNIADVQLGLGDVMYDFSVTDASGKTVTLSEMLAEKEVVLVNFWYTTCTYCLKEFPYMEETYRTWQDKVGIIALNPMENLATVQSFQEANGLTFNMASCPASWPNVFGIQYYPTTVVVDRYGVICMIEVGGIVSATPFNNLYSHFTGDNYQQKLCPNGLEDITVQVTPTYTMPSSEEFSVLNQGEFTVEYKPETGTGGEYSWPFILGEKNGEQVAYASNKGIDSSYAILYANVELKAGQAFAFDYLVSSESGADILYIIVDGEDIYQISGVNEVEKWETCYPWVADRDDTYEIALVYMKDSGSAQGDDTAYVKNFRVVDAGTIETPTYIPRQAAITLDGFEFEYVTVVYNEKDGYYHVGSADGPLLLAALNVASQFNEDKTVLEMLSDGDITVDGKDYYEDVLPYCSYASNSSLFGYCTVTKELAGYLKIVADVDVAGFEDDENEWLKICSYYATYGTDGEQLQDPIAGLATFSAATATLGKNKPGNYFYYDRVIMPRGTFAKFVPTKSGVYRITSRTETDSMVDGWIMDKDMNELTVYEWDERIYADEYNASIVYYMEKGQEYYIDLCFYDLYETGYIYYDIEYIGSSYDHFRLASPGYFTYDANATGEEMYYVIAGGVTPVLKDGKYYVDLGNGKTGSLLYVDFTGYTPIFTDMSLVDIINAGGFDFSKNEDDEFILAYLRQNDNDPEKTKEALREEWGTDYDAYAEIYKVDEVLAGKYHGTGEDLTEKIRPYLNKIYNGSKTERVGCVEMTEELAELLQVLMDKYTFKGVDHSWTKLCYYYDHMGPN